MTSQNISRLNTAHVAGLTLLTAGWESIDIGRTGLIGNAARDTTLQAGAPVVVQGAGADIWGTADSFQFVDAGPSPSTAQWFARVVSVRAAPYVRQRRRDDSRRSCAVCGARDSRCAA